MNRVQQGDRPGAAIALKSAYGFKSGTAVGIASAILKQSREHHFLA